MSAAFVIIAPVITLAALGMLFARKAVHAALLLAVVMIGLAMLYASLDAPFLFAVQIVVYTGAILMLFLFVIMLVGVGSEDRDDDVRERIAGQRVLAWLGGLALGATMVTMVVQASLGTMKGLAGAQPRGNVQALADLMFSRYVVAFEATSALLITAVIGAMVLAHQERLTPRPGQHDLARLRLRDYAERGKPLGPLPPPATYATRNGIDTPPALVGTDAGEDAPHELG